jgi:hypothetical protein
LFLKRKTTNQTPSQKKRIATRVALNETKNRGEEIENISEPKSYVFENISKMTIL